MDKVNMSGRDSSGKPTADGHVRKREDLERIARRPPQKRYAYNTDGSLTADQNKGISAISYNLLGKPQQITYANGTTVVYAYDAAGAKLKTATTVGTVTTTTDYVGGFVYTNNALSFFSSPEGRVVKNGANFEYQYAIADHQGNTRVVFTSAPPAAQTATANFEAATNANFPTSYGNRVNFNLFDHTDPGLDATDYAQKLTGAANSQVGAAKSYKVYAGDRVKIAAYAKYTNMTATGSNLAGFAGALIAAYNLPAPAPGETGTPSAALNTWGGLVAGGNGGSGTVKAFVSIIVFDKNHKLLDFAWDGIDPAANQAGATPVVAHDYVMREYTAKEEGFVYLYVSNESPTLVDVYFDDVAMTYTPGNVVQYNEYYPFGLQTANSWTRENATGNNFLYNGGTELNTTTSVYDLHYRNYDPILGRMNQVDPLASKFGSVTPYNYAFNAPTNFNDPLGDQSWGDIFRVVADLWRQAGANGTANWRRPMDTGSGTAGSWANFGAMGDGGGRPGTLFGGGRSDFFAPGWKPGQGSLSARAFARQDAAIAQAQAARDTQFGFSLFPGATTSGNNTGYYNYMLAPAVESTLNGRVQDSHFATSTVDFGKEDYLKMYADAGMPLGYSSTNQTKPGLQYNQYLDTGLTATGFIAGAFESGSAIATAQNLRTISYSTAKSGLKLTKNLGTVGLVLSAGVAIHEFATDHDNTHTWVDLGVAGLGVAAVAVIGTVALPAVAIIGLGYTVWSAAGGSDG